MFIAFRIPALKVHIQLLSRFQTRCVSTANPAPNGVYVQSKTKLNKAITGATQGKVEKDSKPGKLLKDEDIRHPSVQISHGGRLSAPTTVGHLLSMLDRRGYFIQLVSQRPPIVRIVSKSDEYNRRKQEQEQAKVSKAKQSHKEVQFSWAISEADAVHKMGKAREELERGFRVDLVFTHKRGHPVPSEQEMKQRLAAVVESLAGIGREWRERQFQRRTAVVYLQGTGTVPIHSQREKNGTQKAAEEALSAVAKKRKYNVDPIPQEIWNLFQ